MLQKAELEQRPRSNWNLLKKFANYRAARIFLAATKSFYFATKVTILAVDGNPCDEHFPNRADLKR